MDMMKNLVLVRGLLGGSAQWAAQLEAFFHHFKVLTVDLPGFGLKSEWDAPERIADYADFVLDELSQSRYQAVSFAWPLHGWNDRPGDDGASTGAN